MAATHRTQVCIIGAGPSGLLLSQLLAVAGVDTIVIDRKNRSHIEGRVRAGVLEQGTVRALEEAGVANRLHTEGLIHDGFDLAFDGERHRIDLKALTGKSVMVYGQTEVTKDLFERRVADGQIFYFDVEDVMLSDLKSDRPTVTFRHGGAALHVSCDFVVGCDGFHGVSRKSVPADVLQTFERDRKSVV